MTALSAKIKNIFKVLLLPIVVYVMFFILSGGKFGKSSSLLMNLKQTLAPTLISFAMCSNILCGRMDLSAGAVVMLASMFGAKVVYVYNIGLIPFALIVVGAGVVLGTLSGIMYMVLRVPAIVTALGVCMIYETLSNLTSISWVTAIKGETTTLGRYPYCLILFAIMFVLFYIIFNYTKLGYNKGLRKFAADSKKQRYKYQKNSFYVLCRFIPVSRSGRITENIHTGIHRHTNVYVQYKHYI